MPSMATPQGSNRILFVIGNLDTGGAERHLLQTLPELQRRGYAPSICTLSYRGELADRFEQHGIRVYAPPFFQTFRKLPRGLSSVVLPLSMMRLLGLMWTSKFDIIHFFLPLSYVVGGLVSFCAPVRHRVMSRRSMNTYQRNHPYASRIERWLHTKMDAVLGNSMAVVRQLHDEGVASERLALIYNGIDTAPDCDASVRQDTRTELHIGTDTVVLCLVANILPYKGHASLIEALAQVRDELPAEWVLLCVGEDRGIQAELEQAAKRHGVDGHIQWLGQRQNVNEILQASDIGLLVSYEEGFSNAILESMAAGLPLVVTDVGGNGEAVLDGENGFVVPAGDPTSLGKAIARLAGDADMREAFGQKSRHRIEENFSLERCVDDYATLYQGLLDNASVPKAIRAKLRSE